MFGQLELEPVAVSRAMCTVFAWCEVRCVAASAVPVPASATISAAATESLRAITASSFPTLRIQAPSRGTRLRNPCEFPFHSRLTDSADTMPP